MVFTLLNSQKVPGTPARAASSSEQSPGTNALAGFSFSYIGQPPALLNRLGDIVSPDQDEELQYPSSPSSPSVPDASASSAAYPEPMVNATQSPALTSILRNASPLGKTSHASPATSSAGLTPNPAAAATDSSARSAPPTCATKLNTETSHVSQSNIPNPAETTSSTFASAREAPPPHQADVSTMSSRASPSTSAGTSTHTRCQDTRRFLVTREASSADLVARISQVALEKAEWGEVKLLMERYRREHDELLRRNDESARAYQKEREQASKVSAIADAALSKFEALLLRHEERLALEQQQAESALTDAQRVIADRTGSEADAEARAAAEARRARVEVEEGRRTTEGDTRRAAEATQRNAAFEKKRKLDAERESADQERHDAEKRRAQEEQRKAAEERRKAEVAEEQRKAEVAEEERRKLYAAQRAAAELEKRAYLEAQRLEARQNQERRPKPAKEELKARLEKEKKEAASRSTSVSSTGVLAPTKTDSGRETTKHDPRSVTQEVVGSVSLTLPVRPTLSLQPASAQAPRAYGVQPGKPQGKRSSHAGDSVADRQALVTPTQQMSDDPRTNSPIDLGIRTSVRDPQDGPQPTVAAPRSPPATSAQAAPKASTFHQVAAIGDQNASASHRPAQSAQSATSAQGVVKSLSGGSSAQAVRADKVAHVDVKCEPPDLGQLMTRALQVPAVAAPTGMHANAHDHAQSTPINGSYKDMRFDVPSSASDSSAMKIGEQQRPAVPAPQDKTVPVPTSSSSPHQKTLGSASISMELATSEASGEVDPWVNTPHAKEEHSHRRDDLREERSYPRPAHESYSPPRPATPPPARRYDHWSPTDHPTRRDECSPIADHPTRQDEWSPTRRKRLRPNADAWLPDADDSPPARRARVSPPDDSLQRRRVTAPEPRVQSMRVNTGHWAVRDGPSYDDEFTDDPYPHQAPFSQSYAPPYRDTDSFPPYFDHEPMYDERQGRPSARPAASAHATNSLPQASSWQAEQGPQLEHRIAGPSSLLARLSDNRASASNTTRRRGTASTGRGRGRGNRGGGRQLPQSQRPLPSRLTSGYGEDGRAPWMS